MGNKIMDKKLAFYLNILTFALLCKEKERCLSGRKDMFAKHAYWKRYRGFESLPLRNIAKKSGCSVAWYRATFGMWRS